MNWTTNTNNDDLAFEYTNNYNGKNGFIVDPNSSSLGGTFEFGMSDSSSHYRSDEIAQPTAGVWHLVHIVFDRSIPNNKPYVDGSAASIIGGVHTMLPSDFDNSTLYFMSRGTNSLNGDGALDEVHLSITERSQDWITCEWNNQNSPGTFITVGSEISVSAVQQRRTLSALGTRIGSRQLQEV